MGKGSYFMVYFTGPATLDDAERVLRKSRLTVTRNGGELGARWDAGPELFLGLSDEPHVVLEAQEVAEMHDAPTLASCARRFEVGFDDLEAVLDETNTLFEVGAQLQDLTGGYLHYAWNGNLILPDGKPCQCADCT